MSDFMGRKSCRSVGVSVIDLEPLSAAPEEGATVRFLLCKASQRASVCTLA